MSEFPRGSGAGPIGSPRYSFGEFAVLPARRVLVRSGREIPLIPRYFDLLVMLIERRHEAVSRRDILDTVWSDVVVSDNALNQAVRIVRRALNDDPRSPVFIKTVSRHGYRFIHDVATDERCEPPRHEAGAPAPPRPAAPPHQAALEVLLADRSSPATDPDATYREAAETLHALGTPDALRRLDELPSNPRTTVARAYLRDTRWDVPGAGPVPLLGHPGGVAAFRVLIGLRLRRAWRIVGNRWLSATAGGALAGLVAGLLGGFALLLGPGSGASPSVLVALPLVGLLVGGLGAAGVGAGLATAEATIRSWRRTALVLFGALGGGAIGFSAHLAAMAVLGGLFGGDVSPLAGGLEGLVLGAATGLGYALATPTVDGGMATPYGSARLVAILATGLVGAVAASALGATGSYLGAMSLDFMAATFPGSQVGLDPVARLLGEAAPGPVTRTVISGFEGLMFGAGLALGITRRPH